MAAGAIRVCVLEGIYAKMTELGLPLSLAVELQYRGLRLDSSLWTARLSNGGPWWNKFFRVGPKFVPGGGGPILGGGRVQIKRDSYSVSLFWPSQRCRPMRHRQQRKPKPSHQLISSLNPVSSGVTVGSSYVQKDTTTNRLPLKAHPGIRAASSH